MAEIACKSRCEKGKCSPSEDGKKFDCRSEGVDVVCKEHRFPAAWYDEKVTCDCDCEGGPDKED
jgi:hypothetical protein